MDIQGLFPHYKQHWSKHSFVNMSYIPMLSFVQGRFSCSGYAHWKCQRHCHTKLPMFFTSYSFVFLCKITENKLFLQTTPWALCRMIRSSGLFHGQPEGFRLNLTYLDNETKKMLTNRTSLYTLSPSLTVGDSLLTAGVEQVLGCQAARF